MIWFFSKWHNWTYRNPASRACKKCGRVENFYQTSEDTSLFPAGEWEEMYPLATNKEAKCYET